jgi:hypothetical protein
MEIRERLCSSISKIIVDGDGVTRYEETME